MFSSDNQQSSGKKDTQSSSVKQRNNHLDIRNIEIQDLDDIDKIMGVVRSQIGNKIKSKKTEQSNISQDNEIHFIKKRDMRLYNRKSQLLNVTLDKSSPDIQSKHSKQKDYDQRRKSKIQRPPTQHKVQNSKRVNEGLEIPQADILIQQKLKYNYDLQRKLKLERKRKDQLYRVNKTTLLNNSRNSENNASKADIELYRFLKHKSHMLEDVSYKDLLNDSSRNVLRARQNSNYLNIFSNKSNHIERKPTNIQSKSIQETKPQINKFDLASRLEEIDGLFTPVHLVRQFGFSNKLNKPSEKDLYQEVEQNKQRLVNACKSLATKRKEKDQELKELIQQKVRPITTNPSNSQNQRRRINTLTREPSSLRNTSEGVRKNRQFFEIHQLEDILSQMINTNDKMCLSIVNHLRLCLLDGQITQDDIIQMIQDLENNFVLKPTKVGVKYLEEIMDKYNLDSSALRKIRKFDI
ncbi:hypothetical protein pb186bvf_001191 [Paramecium bursaria]